jgi:hypothetical protein
VKGFWATARIVVADRMSLLNTASGLPGGTAKSFHSLFDLVYPVLDMGVFDQGESNRFDVDVFTELINGPILLMFVL